ncbi:hypothetical protein [Roseovarius spongiae]|uniref:hypothetical protein n=1 Tax=Roseovarius spongiae TaxID=2320272 RepID=UPI0011C42279|nr:hypothetical protein [Roseovarius spongiae]
MSEAELTIAAIGTLANLLIAGAAIAAAIAAFMGLDTWKKEKTWQRDNELSEQLLELLYRRKDAVTDIRRPWSIQSAATHDEDGNEINDANYAAYLGTVNYYQSKVETLTTIRAETYARQIRASIVWGEEFGLLNTELRHQEDTLIAALRRFFRSQNPRVRQKLTDEKYSEIDGIIYEGLEEDDIYRRDYERIFTSVENYLRSKLDSPK